MNKTLPKLLCIFSGLIFIYVFHIIFGVLVSVGSSSSNEAMVISFLILGCITLIVESTSIIGSFLISILMLLKSKDVEDNLKKTIKETSIITIILTSVSLGLGLFVFLFPYISLFSFVGIIITFGFAITLYKKIENTKKQEISVSEKIEQKISHMGD